MLSQYIDLFITFLKREGVYEEFNKEFKKNHECDARLSTMLDIMIEEPAIFVSGYFIWDYTEKGLKYWSAVNEKWAQELKSSNLPDIETEEEQYKREHLLDEFINYITNSPEEELREEWNKYAKYDEIGETADNFIKRTRIY